MRSWGRRIILAGVANVRNMERSVGAETPPHDRFAAPVCFLGIVQIPEVGGPDLSVLDHALERLSIRIVVDDSHAHLSSAAPRDLVVEPLAANPGSSVAFHDVDPRNEQTRGNLPVRRLPNH